jgi:outer membrane protein
MKMARFTSKCLYATLLCALALGAWTLTASAAETGKDGFALTVDEAVVTALQNNRSLQVQKLTPNITGLNEIKQKAAFDPSLTSAVSDSQSDTGVSKTHGANGSVQLSKKFDQGAQVTAGLTTANSSSRTSDSLYSSRFVISLNQPLYNGAGSAFNLASLHQAELDTKTAYYNLQGYAESLIDQVVSTYWDYSLAQRQLQIYDDSLKLAEQQLDETQTMVQVGKLAEIELVSAQAEVSSRKQARINAQSKFETLRIKLLGLLHPTDVDFWKSSVTAKDEFVIPNVKLGELDAHIQTALASRPDLITARFAYEKGVLDVVKTKNGLLPYLSFFVTLGNTDYAHAFAQSYGDILGNGHDSLIGINYSLNIGKRNEKANYDQSLLKKEQATIAIENMEATVQQDVRSAWIEIQRSESQIEATRATMKLQDEKSKAETEKYYIGKSTSINVAVTQRDLLQSRLDEAQAIADYVKALQSLYLAEGSILKQYGASIR